MSAEKFLLDAIKTGNGTEHLKTVAEKLEFWYEHYWNDWDIVAAYINHPEARLDLIAEAWRFIPGFVESQPRWNDIAQHSHWAGASASPQRKLPLSVYSVPAFYMQDLINKKDIEAICHILDNSGGKFFERWVHGLTAMDNRIVDRRLVLMRGDEDVIRQWLPHFAKSRHAAIRLATAKHQYATPEVLRLLCTDTDEKIAAAAIAHPHFPEDALAVLAEHEENKQGRKLDQLATLNWKELGDILTHADFQSEGLEVLMERRDEAILFACAMHPNAGEAIWRTALDAAEPWKRAAAALNPNLPEAILRELARSDDFDIAFALASNPNLPEDMRLALAHHPDRLIRLHVADQTLSVPIWTAVASHPAPEYLHTPLEQLLAIAIDPATKKEKLERLQGPINFTRSDGGAMATCISNAIAVHPNFPKSMLGEYRAYIPWLAEHNKLIQMMVLEGRPLPEPEPYFEVWFTDTKVIKGCGYIANYLLASHDQKLRRMAAAHGGCNKTLLLPLWHTADAILLKKVAQRTDLPRFFYEILWMQGDGAVRSALLDNKGSAARNASYMHGAQPITVNTPTKKMATGAAGETTIKGSKKERVALAKSSTDEMILRTLASDKSIDVRSALIERKDLPLSTLEILANDPDETLWKEIPNLLHHLPVEQTLALEMDLYRRGDQLVKYLAWDTRQESLQKIFVDTSPQELCRNRHVTPAVAEVFLQTASIELLLDLACALESQPDFAVKVASMMLEIMENQADDPYAGASVLELGNDQYRREAHRQRLADFVARQRQELGYFYPNISSLLQTYPTVPEMQKLILPWLKLRNSEENRAWAARVCTVMDQETLLNLTKESVEIRVALAENPSIPNDIVDILKIDNDETVRSALCLSKPATASFFLHDQSIAVRSALAGYTRDVDIQKKLGDDQDIKVLNTLASNPHCDLEVFIAMAARNLDFDVRRYVVENPETSDAKLEFLLKDRTAWIRNAAHRILEERANLSAKAGT